MSISADYPVFLDLTRARCLVVGAGAVGRRKIEGLLAGGARRLLVLDTDPGVFGKLPVHPALSFEARAFTPQDVQGCMLVFAATNRKEVNAAVAEVCVAAGVLCNRADAPEDGTFLAPVAVRAGKLAAALSTGGTSPAYAGFLREELAAWLTDKVGPAALFARIRPLLLGRDTGRQILCSLARSELGSLLAAGDEGVCRAELERLLPEDLHPRITEFLHGLV